MGEETVVYTVVTGGYDLVFPPLVRTEGVRYVLFTDSARARRGWEVRALAAPASTAPVLVNRWHKLFAHELFPDAACSIYVDGNIRILGDLTPLIREFSESGAAMGLFAHRDRQNIHEEAGAAAALNRIDSNDRALADAQIEHYLTAGMPQDQPLSDNGVLFRRHDHPKLAGAMSLWWEQLHAYTRRDQLSLPYVVWHMQLPVMRWAWSFRNGNEFFARHPHRQSPIGDLYTILRVRSADAWWARLAFGAINAARGRK